MSQPTAFARDYKTANNFAFARRIFARLTGQPGTQWGGDYSNFYIIRNGRTYRFQLIAGTHGTGPHTHGGGRLV